MELSWNYEDSVNYKPLKLDHSMAFQNRTIYGNHAELTPTNLSHGKAHCATTSYVDEPNWRLGFWRVKFILFLSLTYIHLVIAVNTYGKSYDQ